MNRKTILLCLLFVPCLTWAQINYSLSYSIDSLAALDQHYCEIYRKVQNREIDSITLAQAETLRSNCFENNFVNAQEILNQYGYPDKNVISAQSVYNFWLIVQHMDSHVAFQQRVLDSMQVRLANNLINTLNWVYLTDRVLINQSQPQIYGTQVMVTGNPKKHTVKPTVKPEELNARRQRVGLQPIEEYLQLMDRLYYGELKDY